MKRKLLAAAVTAACASPALAQVPAEIQVYGRVNVSVEHITVSNSSNTTALPNQSTNELVDNSSRIGFRGNKELNTGLKVIWQVESRVKLDDGSGSTFSSRDSYAGLQGGFGTIRAGRSIGPVYYATYDYISLHNHDTGTSSDNLLNPTIFGNAGFMNNLLWYTTPNFSGFSADVAYSFGPTTANEGRAAGVTDQPNYIGLVGAYDKGGLHVAVSYAETKNTSALAVGTGNDDKAYTIGALYDFKAFVLGGLFEKSKSDLAGGGSGDRTYWRVSGMLPVGQHEFHVNYGMANDTDPGTDNGAKQYTLAYNYNITKATKVYAFYTTVDNDTNGTYGFRQVTPAVAGADFKSIAIGLRHNF
ncbi:MAG TPA: porin [Burkholderiales bacterium]|nr:porin [Burkholderiales bacterium]